MKKSHEEWCRKYDAWQQEATKEAKERFPAFADGKVEVGEDGSVFFRGCIHTQPRTVTPWKDSPYYEE